MDNILSNYSLVSVDFNPFSAGEIAQIIPISESQLEIWLACAIGGDDGNRAYNESISLRFEGRLNREALTSAIQFVVNRHEALRCTVSEDGEYLYIYKKKEVDLGYDDLTESTVKEQEKWLAQFGEKAGMQPFNLSNGPLIRFHLIKLDDEGHILWITAHHIICDGWSYGVILEEISSIYTAIVQGNVPSLPTAFQLSAYVAEMEHYKTTDAYREVVKYWTRKLTPVPQRLNLPLDKPRSSQRTFNSHRYDVPLASDLATAIQQLGASQGTTFVNILLAAFEVFLNRLTNESDIVVGLPTAGQLATGHFQLVGHCVNFLPIRTKIDTTLSFAGYLERRKSQLLDDYDHQLISYGSLLKGFKIKRDNSRAPFISTVFNVDLGTDLNVNFHNLKHTLASTPRPFRNFELFVNVANRGDSFVLEWAYHTEIFKAASIKWMSEAFTNLLGQITSEPHTQIGEIHLDLKDELSDTFGTAIKPNTPSPNPFPEYVDYSCTYPKNTTLLDLFLDHVRQNPNGIAVRFSNRELTYKALDAKSSQLANYLNAQVDGERLIPILTLPSLEMIIGILGILKSGRAYVPIDPEFPEHRIRHILEECKSSVIISDTRSETLLQNVKSNSQEICLLDKPDDACWIAESSLRKTHLPNPEDDAYLIYTSGSTGTPKGVMIAHKSLVDYFSGLQQHIPRWGDCQSFALGSSIATDLGNTVLFGALVSGATLHVFLKEQFNDTSYIKDYFEKNRIDCLKIVPSHWKYLSEASGGLFPKKLLIFGGELLPGHFIKTIADNAPDCTIVNHYGPTETTIGKLMHIVDKSRDYGVSVPIGKPFSNTTILILDAEMRFCPVGVPGELYIGGEGLSSGYYNNPAQTADVFIPNPVQHSNHPTVYKTGDLVKWSRNGDIEYLGRNDNQIKIRGYRVELGEIERMANKLLPIRECIVIADKQDIENTKLCAFVVPLGNFSSFEATAELKKHLPEYMVPRTWSAIEEVPRMANGKIDRQALLNIDYQSERSTTTYVAPTTPTQIKLRDFWASCLKTEKEIGITDDFFELGGHSLIAVRLMGLIRQHFGRNLPLATLFDHPTIENLAEVIDQNLNPMKWDCVIPVRKEGNKPPLYVIHGQLLDILFIRNLLPYLDSDQPLYGIQGMGLSGKSSPIRKVEVIARHYVDEILTHTPNGPYMITGYSSGGVYALEVARLLENMGKKVLLVGLLDTYATNPQFPNIKAWLKFYRHYAKVSLRGRSLPRKILMSLSYFAFRFTADFIIKFNYRLYWVVFGLIADKNYRLTKLQAVHYSALESFRLKNFQLRADIYLFKSPWIELMACFPGYEYNGWKQHIKQEITVVPIKGDHNSMFTFDQGLDLGTQLQATLRNAFEKYHRTREKRHTEPVA